MVMKMAFDEIQKTFAEQTCKKHAKTTSFISTHFSAVAKSRITQKRCSCTYMDIQTNYELELHEANS